MSLSFSIVLIAAGAILAFAVEDNVTGLDVAAIGWILMLVGLIGALLSMLFWSSFAPFAESDIVFTRRRVQPDGGPLRRTVVDEYEDVEPVTRRRVTEEQYHDHV